MLHLAQDAVPVPLTKAVVEVDLEGVLVYELSDLRAPVPKARKSWMSRSTRMGSGLLFKLISPDKLAMAETRPWPRL